MFKRVLPLVALILVFAPLQAQEKLNTDINARIRQEEASHSQILRTLHYLADVYGPRVTGSPSHKSAAEWAVKQMEGWALMNGRLEPWDFGHPGWVIERFSGHITSPVKDQVTADVCAWTPATIGTLTASAVHLLLPDRPTPAELTAFLDGVKDKVKGRIF